jgi:hypothetical protein
MASTQSRSHGVVHVELSTIRDPPKFDPYPSRGDIPSDGRDRSQPSLSHASSTHFQHNKPASDEDHATFTPSDSDRVIDIEASGTTGSSQRSPGLSLHLSNKLEHMERRINRQQREFQKQI